MQKVTIKMKDNLFRSQVINRKKTSSLGMVSLNIPPSYTFISGAYGLLIVVILLFVSFADISEKYTVRGYLNSSKGMVSVYPQKLGIIMKSFVHQGQQVHLGEALFEVNTSYTGLDTVEHSQTVQQLKKRKERLEIEVSRKRVQIHRLKTLLDKKFISLHEVNQEQETLDNLYANLNAVILDLIKYQEEQRYTVYAPVDGTVASMINHLGQATQLTKPLVKILPKDAKILAELYIPVRQAGFLNKENRIMIHYDAYPYQHFGSFTAHIKAISESILLDEEDEKPLKIGEPYYKVYAKLAQNSIQLYDHPKQLQPGMTFSALIIGSKRKVWQWLLEPLYTFYGSVG